MLGSLPKSDRGAFDPSTRAHDALDQILDETSEITAEVQANAAVVDDELRKQRILEAESTRIKSRVLFVTNNSAVIEKQSLAQRTIVDLQDVFDEVHVLVLGKKGSLKRETLRLAPKVWAYTVSSKFFFRIPFVARALAKEEMEFTDGFRPDLIVALEPFESAMTALFIAERFDRPFQVHIKDDDFLHEKKFLAADTVNTWRLRFMRYTLKRATSVRVSTDTIKNSIAKRYKHVKDLALLPRFFNVRQLLDLPLKPSVDTFPQFSFVTIFIGELGASSTLFRAVDAVRPILQTPSIGFVVLGDGPLRAQFKQRAALLKIDKQVLFLGALPNYFDTLRSADVLLVTDTESESEDLVIQAAAAGVPLIMAKTALRSDLFEDGVHAFLCEPEDTLGFSSRLRTFLNTNALRTQFAENGREVIRTRIEEDPQLYRIAYRDTIEKVFYDVTLEPTKQEAQKVAETAKEAEKAPQIEMVDGIEMRVPGA